MLKLKLPAPSTTDAAWKFSRRPGGWILAERVNADGSIDRQRFMAQQSGDRVGAQLSGALWQIEVISGREGATVGGDSGASLIAQFPGKVRKLIVAAGATVEAGQPLLLVEAMKMEFAVKAPANGTIKAVLVKEGQQLSPGDKFFEFEATEIAGSKPSGGKSGG